MRIICLNNLDKLSFTWLHLRVETHFISSFPRRGTEFTYFLFLISKCSPFPPYLPSWQQEAVDTKLFLSHLRFVHFAHSCKQLYNRQGGIHCPNHVWSCSASLPVMPSSQQMSLESLGCLSLNLPDTHIHSSCSHFMCKVHLGRHLIHPAFVERDHV